MKTQFKHLFDAFHVWHVWHFSDDKWYIPQFKEIYCLQAWTKHAFTLSWFKFSPPPLHICPLIFKTNEQNSFWSGLTSMMGSHFVWVIMAQSSTIGFCLLNFLLASVQLAWVMMILSSEMLERAADKLTTQAASKATGANAYGVDILRGTGQKRCACYSSGLLGSRKKSFSR